MHWQSDGNYLAVLLDQSSERHPSAYINIAIFELKKPHIPVEFFEFERESKIVAFAWEPKGHRFGVIQGGYNPSINFYTIKGGPENCSRRKLSTLASTKEKFLFWSPGGRFIVIVGLTPYSGELTFYDVDLLQVLATKKTMAMNIQWNPTGRFVATRCPPFSKKKMD
ncbi:Eukaryotic translation initiation factor 3 subunit B [Quillaja saponaria]|uniref:Eukaryotic translation initiation factor 3 subunit B n=1 Tax=Quillaja saponaria TaxID=32244 RepID=A0AAD7QD56_QUISA|nr:Eukaryotic translation initiation factor 3 subunit B [Quillaja saponaria]